MKTLPKSLHTVTVIVRLARHIERYNPHATNEGLVRLALQILGHVEFADDHGLITAAVKQLEG